MKTDKVYFPGLNGLRIIAALLVFFAHLEGVKKLRGMSNLDDTHFFNTAGGSGVSLFFCISGFLITFLLLSEREIIGTISLKDFYIRRILRIWPLYYLVLFLTLFIIPYLVFTPGFSLEYKTSFPVFILYFFFCPYIADPYYQKNLLAAVLWSVGVEETFYLIWPVMVREAKKLRLGFFIAVLLGFLLIKGIITYESLTIASLQPVSRIFAHLRLECMIIGGAFAYLFKCESPFISYIKKTYVFISTLVLLIIYLFVGFDLVFSHLHIVVSYMLDALVNSALYCIILINVISRKGVYRVLEHKIIFELGRISYGFYLYHMICLMIVFLVFEKAGWSQAGYLTICIPALLLTAAMSYVSYYLFEMRFLKWKQKFTHIISGQEAKSASID